MSNVVEYLENNPSVGIMAFKILNFHSLTLNKDEYPFKRYNHHDPDEQAETSWFIGAGHAFHRKVIDSIGYYRDFFPYGHEEQDFSLRAINAGFEIHYFPKVVVFHKKSQLSRVSDPVQFSVINYKNRVKVAMLNLPRWSVLSYAIIWFFYHVIKYKNARFIFFAASKIKSEFSYIRDNRRVVSNRTVRKLFRLKGQLFY